MVSPAQFQISLHLLQLAISVSQVACFGKWKNPSLVLISTLFPLRSVHLLHRHFECSVLSSWYVPNLPLTWVHLADSVRRMVVTCQDHSRIVPLGKSGCQRLHNLSSSFAYECTKNRLMCRNSTMFEVPWLETTNVVMHHRCRNTLEVCLQGGNTTELRIEECTISLQTGCPNHLSSWERALRLANKNSIRIFEIQSPNWKWKRYPWLV